MDSPGSPNSQGDSIEATHDSPTKNVASNLSEKQARIRHACDTKDLQALTELATSEGGLLNDELRKLGWPLLLGCTGHAKRDRDLTDWSSLPKHRDEEQVKLDVHRAFVYYPDKESTHQLDLRREKLLSLIIEVLRRHPYLYYFQGFHDIAQVFLLVLSRDGASEPVARLAVLRIRDFMLPTMEASVDQLRLLPAILQQADPGLAGRLLQIEPFFALSSTITMYAHDIESYGDIARLYDFLLARPAVVSIYLFAAIIMSRRGELLQVEPDEPDMLHSILSKLPKPLDLEHWIAGAMSLYERSPPESLPTTNWRSISSSSVLKTTRDTIKLTNQSLQDGARLFEEQKRHIIRRRQLGQLQSSIWSYRRPVGAISVTVFVALLSYWLRRDDTVVGLLGTYWQLVRRALGT